MEDLAKRKMRLDKFSTSNNNNGGGGISSNGVGYTISTKRQDNLVNKF